MHCVINRVFGFHAVILLVNCRSVLAGQCRYCVQVSTQHPAAFGFQLIATGLRHHFAPLINGLSAHAQGIGNSRHRPEMLDDVFSFHGVIVSMLYTRCQAWLFLLTNQSVKVAYMTSKTDTMGDRIKASREALGMTQQQLADKVGVTRVAITNWESGEQNNLRNENLFKVADILGKSARWLALGDGPETPPETLYDAIAALPKQSPQQTLDFLAFQWNNAEGLIASDRIASYTAMIDKMRKDMEQKKNGT